MCVLCGYAVQTKSLVALEELLQEIRPKYLRPKHFIRVKGAKMSEQEKDEFDAVSRRTTVMQHHCSMWAMYSCIELLSCAIWRITRTSRSS